MSNLLKKRKLHPSIWELLFSIPKTIWFNLKVLPFKQAIKLPFFVSLHTKVKGVNRKNFICNIKQAKFGLCRIGIAGSETGLFIKNKSAIYIHNGGKIYVNGVLALSRGIYLESNGGTIVFGDGVKMNTGCYVESQFSSITIGDNCSFGWNCTIKNNDGHTIIVDGVLQKNNGDIFIGKHCWICSEATILKNGFLGDDCVLAYKSLLTKKVSDKNNCLYAGVPATIIKENISWEV